MLWLLGSAQGCLLIGDRRGRKHVLRHVSGPALEAGDLLAPLPVRSLAELRRALSDLDTPTVSRVRHVSGLDVTCIWAQGRWLVVVPRGAPAAPIAPIAPEGL